jgi:hypothetical protein
MISADGAAIGQLDLYTTDKVRGRMLSSWSRP